MGRRFRLFFVALIIILATLTACAPPLPWPEPPLVEFSESDPDWQQPETVEAAVRSDAYRVRRLILHWIHEGALELRSDGQEEAAVASG